MGESWGCAAPGALLLSLVALIVAALIAAGPVPNDTRLGPTPTPTRAASSALARCVPGRLTCRSLQLGQP